MVVKKKGSEVWARIRNLACIREDYLACLLDAHSLARQQGFAGIIWKAPLLPGIEQELSTAGFSRDRDFTLLIFEKNYSKD